MSSFPSFGFPNSSCAVTRRLWWCMLTLCVMSWRDNEKYAHCRRSPFCGISCAGLLWNSGALHECFQINERGATSICGFQTGNSDKLLSFLGCYYSTKLYRSKFATIFLILKYFNLFLSKYSIWKRVSRKCNFVGRIGQLICWISKWSFGDS